MGSIGRTRKAVLLGGSALAMVLSASPGALAQDCVQQPFTTNNPAVTFFTGFESTYRTAASTASSLSGAIGNVDTVFLTQQGSAFVSNPGGAPPNTQGGGVWVRGLGGEVETTTTSTSNLTMTGTVPGGGPFTLGQAVNCASVQRQNFGGVQVGSDVARLNMGGWNVNIGTTAGYLEARSKERLGVNPFQTDIEVPFAGTYIVATYGNFFVDAMVRTQYYNIELNSPNANLYGQPVGAHGISFSTSAGYQFQFANNWFIEPSAGFVWSKTEVDEINLAGAPGTPISGTLSLNDIESQIGRLSLRVGTTFATGNMVLQPFVTASVFHEFADDTTSVFRTCTNCLVFGPGPVLPADATITTTASRIGTYGQISAGIAGQVTNTGWVGFVRGDYRKGDDLEGWTANAGLRYNFLPAIAAAPVIGKGPVYKAPPPVVTAINWTGFYVGGFFGADYGDSEIRFLGTNEISKPDIKGFIGGGQVGYNHQFGTWVLGVEGDIGATNKTGGRACGVANGLSGGPVTFGVPTGAFTPFFFTCENDLEWLATLGARVGFTWDRALFYAKGGGAWTTTDFSANCILGPRNGLDSRSCFSPGGVFTNSFGTSNDRWGWMVGLGTEFALTPNWSAKAEWNFIDFGRDTFVLTDGTSITDSTSIQEVKIGVNYHFTPMTR
jgi:opacity protein-like surface antigen